MAIEFKKPEDPDLAGVLNRDGVVFIENVLNNDLINELRHQLELYERDVLPVVPRSYYDYEVKKNVLYQYRDPDRFSPWFKKFSEQPWILELASKAVSWTPIFYYLEIFPKPPGSKGVSPHQELYTAPVDPPDFLHVWIPLVDITDGNGGITFYPGTHRLGLAPHIERPGYSPMVHPDVMERVQPFRVDLTCRAGSVALFGGNIIHHSGPNTTDRARPALIVGLRGKSTKTKGELELVAGLISRLCREQLGIESCDMNDDLTPSMAAAPQAADRIIAHLSEHYRVGLDYSDIVDHQTPAKLAERIFELRDRKSDEQPGA
jgi:phytanoyl-CoA hydroxylase